MRKERIYIQRGSVFFMQGDFNAAKDDAFAALSLRISTSACFILGNIEEKQGNFKEAYAFYSRTSDWVNFDDLY